MTDPSMIVEFFGLPGSGKSALARELTARLSHEGVSFNNVLAGLGDRSTVIRVLHKASTLVGGAIRDPWFFAYSGWTILKTRQRSLRDLVRVAVNWCYIATIIKLSRKNGAKVILDQGLLQSIWSIYLSARNHVDIDALFSRAELPDLLIIVQTDLQVASERRLRRSNGRSRLERPYGADYNELERRAIDGFRAIVRHVERSGIRTVVLDNNSVGRFESKVQAIANPLLSRLTR